MKLALQIAVGLVGWLAIFAGLLLLAALGAWFSSQPWAPYVLAFVIGCAVGSMLQAGK